MIFTPLFLNLFITILIFFHRWGEKNRSFIYLSAIILIASVRQLELILYHQTTYSAEYAVILIHANPLYCLIGPIIYYYFRSIINGKMIIDYYFLIFLIPSFIIIINSFNYYELSFEKKIEYATLKQNENHLNFIDFPLLLFNNKYQRLIMPIFNLSFIAYSLFYLYKKNKLKELKPKVKIIFKRILWISLIYMLPLVFLFINSTNGLSFSSDFTYKNQAPSFQIIYFMTLIPTLSILIFPNLVFGDNHNSTKLKNNFFNKKISINSNINVEEKTEINEDLNRILNYIDTKKPYLNTDFSIHELSQTMNIPQIRISNCFNKQINIPFPKYRNDLRIKHAVHMFREQKHLKMSIEGIAIHSGFKTKSAFYAAFKSVYNMTPTEWIEKNQKNMGQNVN